MLTEKEITHAKSGFHLDGNGLYLQVTKTGAKSWLFRYQLHGKRRWAGVVARGVVWRALICSTSLRSARTSSAVA